MKFMYQTRRIGRSGFSLIELVIVVVIIAIIGAIAIPKMSRGATGAAESALIQNLSVLRSALDLYQTENGGTYPAAGSASQALLTYNDGMGTAVTYSPTKDTSHIYGPYLRSVPSLPVGAAKGSTTIAALAASGVGWVYDATTGKIASNTTGTEVDSKNLAYSAY